MKPVFARAMLIVAEIGEIFRFRSAKEVNQRGEQPERGLPWCQNQAGDAVGSPGWGVQQGAP